MEIDRITSSVEAGRPTISATLHWEQGDRPPTRLYFQTEAEFAADLTLCAEAFVTGALFPAIYFGERRMRVAAPLCPELREGLSTAMALMHHWYGESYRLIAIEGQDVSTPAVSNPRQPRAAIFLSGGVDSLAVLRTNHLRLPVGHPDRIQDGILIGGFDIGGVAGQGPQEAIFQRALGAARSVAADCGIRLIPVRTNLRHLMNDHQFWLNVFHGAALSAVGHALSGRIDRINIASSNAISRIAPLGSHPVLDSCFRSTTLQVRHTGLHHTRLERVKYLADWPVALANLRVCGRNPQQGLNCGRCEKCVRTMTQLTAVGALHRSDAFPFKKVTTGMIAKQPIQRAFQAAHYWDLLPLLQRRKRFDLVRRIRINLVTYRLIHRHLERWALIPRLKRMDSRILGGAGLDRYRRFRRWEEERIQ